MVILYTGTPGSGKSYHATDLVHTATRRRKNIIANFAVTLPEKQQSYFYFIDSGQLTVRSLLDFSREHHEPDREGQTILIIDEAATKFNVNNSGKGMNGWIKFFSQHRKLGYDVILIAQNDRMLDRQIRSNVEYQYIHRRLSNFGLKGFLIRLLLHKDFVCVHQWYILRERLGAEYFRIRKRIACSYDTFSLFDYAERSSAIGGFVNAADFNRSRQKGGKAVDPENAC